MESDLASPADPPVCLAQDRHTNTLCTTPGASALAECVSQTPTVSADLLDSFSLIEPPPLDWRSDSSSDAGSVEDLDETAFPSSLGEQGVKAAEVEVNVGQLVKLAPASDLRETSVATPPMGARQEGRVEALGVWVGEGGEKAVKAVVEVGQLVELATPSDLSEPSVAKPPMGGVQQEVEELGVWRGKEEAEVNGRPTTEEDVIEDEVLEEIVDKEDEVHCEEEDLALNEARPVPERTPGDEDYTHIHALLNRLHRMGEEPAPDPEVSTSDLDPYAHQHHHHHHPADTGPSGADAAPPATETTGLLFSESHQRDLLGLLECTEIAATPSPQHQHHHHHHCRNDWRLPRKESSYASSLPDDQLSEPVWMKREPEVEEEGEEASGGDEEVSRVRDVVCYCFLWVKVTPLPGSQAVFVVLTSSMFCCFIVFNCFIFLMLVNPSLRILFFY